MASQPAAEESGAGKATGDTDGPPTPKGRPVTSDHQRKKQPATRETWVVLEPEASEALETATLELFVAEQVLRQNDTTEHRKARDDAQAKQDAARDEARECSERFVFRSIGRTRFDALVEQHPPSEEQVAKNEREQKDRPAWNWDTFPESLVAASIQVPKHTAQDIKEMFASDDWSGAELDDLFATALAANQSSQVFQLGKESGVTRASAKT